MSTALITAEVSLSAEQVAKSLRFFDAKTGRAWVQEFVLSLDSDLYHHAGETIKENPVSYVECPRCKRMTDPCRWENGRKVQAHCEYCKAVLG